MNPPWVYMCSPSWPSLPPPSPSHPSGSSQCTSPEHPVSCIQPGLVICFTYGNIHVSMLFSQIIPPRPSFSHRVQKSVKNSKVSSGLVHLQTHTCPFSISLPQDNFCYIELKASQANIPFVILNLGGVNIFYRIWLVSRSLFILDMKIKLFNFIFSYFHYYCTVWLYEDIFRAQDF